MLILYEHMFFLSNIMFIFFVCFSCFFICHPLLLWQKNKPEQNGIPIPFCSGLSRIADSSCPSDYPSLFNYYFSTTLFNNDAFTVFSVKCCNHFFHGVDIKSVASTFYKKAGCPSTQTLSPTRTLYVLVLNSLLPLKAVYLYLH